MRLARAGVGMKGRGRAMDIRRIWSGAYWWITLLAVALVTGSACWLLRGPHRFMAPALPFPNIPSDIEIRLHHVHLRGVSGGKVVWEMLADDFDLSKSRPTLHITGLKQVAVLQQGKQAMNVSADNVEKNTVTGDITMSGNVCVTGEKLQMHTQTVIWQAMRGLLCFPTQSTAQLGDYALIISGNTTFDTPANHLLCYGPVSVRTQGDTITAGGADVDIAHHQLILLNKVSGDFAVANLQDWTEGRHVPVAPQIPSAVQQRYHDYCQQQGLPQPGALAPAATGAVSPSKGVRP